MPKEKVVTVFKDYDRTYEITADHKLTPEECKKALTDYFKRPDHLSPITNKFIQFSID